ncbi:DsbA family protein [Ostreiculturibacter nitratireducens]|uniref:DsbA family protein n=1 Tax=Ostreiculturibacter nitratireducens TaxID=3075226 RepID=UPI0031B5BEC6
MKPAALGLAALLLATPALAFDPAAMSESEREAFRAEVRAYLLENPEVLMEAISALEAKQAEAQIAEDANLILANAADIYDDGWSWVGGNPEGNITIVEFVDYRCGYCRKAHPDVQALVDGDDDIRYVIKEFPILGDQSVIASRFAIATLRVAGEDAYKKVHDGFYEDFRGDVTVDTLSAFAEDLGLDTDAILAAMDAPEVTKIIEENHLLAQRLKISGTPTFVLGDQMVRGYVPLDAMQSIVAEVRG